jgi:hypothetical protein
MAGEAVSGKRRRYVICLRDDDAGDLEPRKLYEVLADDVAAESGYLRVIDESGEDYLYPADYFAEIDVPKEVERVLAARAPAAR